MIACHQHTCVPTIACVMVGPSPFSTAVTRCKCVDGWQHRQSVTGVLSLYQQIAYAPAVFVKRMQNLKSEYDSSQTIVCARLQHCHVECDSWRARSLRLFTFCHVLAGGPQHFAWGVECSGRAKRCRRVVSFRGGGHAAQAPALDRDGEIRDESPYTRACTFFLRLPSEKCFKQTKSPSVRELFFPARHTLCSLQFTAIL